MFKHLKSEKSEAVLMFLIGIILTMTVSAYEIHDLKAQNDQCKAPDKIAFNVPK